MAKLKNPLFSLGAIGDLAKALTFIRRRKQDLVEEKPIPFDPQSALQLDWRHLFLKVVALWHALTPAEQQEWQTAAGRHHLTGYQWFVSQALRPNPGIYLPLQGGTMAGNIDMAKYRLLRLPAPADAQEALRLSEYTTNIAPYLYNEGARVYHNANQSIPNTTDTALTFNSERYDTDAIHSTTVNPSRLTCKTAGKYVITGCAYIDTLAASKRFHLSLKLNGTAIAINMEFLGPSSAVAKLVTTIYDLAVNEYVELYAYHDGGIPKLILTQANWSPEFSMQRIGA